MKIWVWDSPHGLVAFRIKSFAMANVTDMANREGTGVFQWLREDDTLTAELYDGSNVRLHKVKVM